MPLRQLTLLFGCGSVCYSGCNNRNKSFDLDELVCDSTQLSYWRCKIRHFAYWRCCLDAAACVTTAATTEINLRFPPHTKSDVAGTLKMGKAPLWGLFRFATSATPLQQYFSPFDSSRFRSYFFFKFFVNPALVLMLKVSKRPFDFVSPPASPPTCSPHRIQFLDSPLKRVRQVEDGTRTAEVTLRPDTPFVSSARQVSAGMICSFLSWFLV